MSAPPQPIANFIAALQMLERFSVLDLTVHTYSATLADAMSGRIRVRYLTAFQRLREKL